MGLLTYGLGDNTLLTNGLGGATVVVVNPKILARTQGSGVGLHHKKRVKGIHLENESKTVLLQTINIARNKPLKILDFLKLTHKSNAKLRKMLKDVLESKMEYDVIILKNKNDKLLIKEKHLLLKDDETTFDSNKIVNFIEKQIKIKDNRLENKEKDVKHINIHDTLDNIEVTELMDIIKEMEDE